MFYEMMTCKLQKVIAVSYLNLPLSTVKSYLYIYIQHNDMCFIFIFTIVLLRQSHY